MLGKGERIMNYQLIAEVLHQYKEGMGGAWFSDLINEMATRLYLEDDRFDIDQFINECQRGKVNA